MGTDEADPVKAIVRAILEHLHSQPLAADSAEGVARWWLGPAHARVTEEQVAEALDLLVEGQQMRRLRLLDGTFLYLQVPPTRQ